MANHTGFRRAVVLLGFLMVAVLTETADSLYVGAFNMQVFGPTKASNKNVMKYLAKIAVRYDILLLQEIRDSQGKAVEELLKRIKRDHRVDMSLEISDRLGRNYSKEQYAFLYRADRGVSVLDKYHFDDGDKSTGRDLFAREPFIVRFKVRDCTPKNFTLAAIHVAPKTAVLELQNLMRVYDDIRQKWSTDNIMILGDLNAGCDYVRRRHWADIPIHQDAKFFWPIRDEVDTTVKSTTDCAYDRFIVAGDALKKAVVQDSAGVFDFQSSFSLTEEEALKVSDHYPIELTLRDCGPSHLSSKASKGHAVPAFLSGIQKVWNKFTGHFANRRENQEL